ncbi:hypothetical protein WOLCODRAFT_163991 [Wolfiporia cocos MD-104 SS10]|uniref:Uncharacterized protein n=1 Tax=Wolfiporia cocos (strain MD-104) TaxID=742152 RepID=A0A2H3JKJ7_WOLCO|nr:hypothetical protein WOLCODRAFT_163991 [Wolfiporia cocos MD-104 SS10]
MTPTVYRKRKYRLQDSTVDSAQMKMSLQRLHLLKEKLDGIEETEEGMGTVMEHVSALEDILTRAKKPRINFSMMTKVELQKLGVVRKRFNFIPEKLTELTARLTSKAQTETSLLRSRILEIYEHVNMDSEPGSRMILEAILLTLAKIASEPDSKLDVAIFPEMNFVPTGGVQLVNPLSGYELWLSGSVDYAVIRYKNIKSNKARLLALGGSRDDALEIAQDRLFLVEAKRMSKEGSSLASSIPEAVSRAIALAKVTSRDEVRFCLSNGQTWIFCILRAKEGRWTYYESAPYDLDKVTMGLTDEPLRKIIQLTFEWLAPITTDLYEFE